MRTGSLLTERWYPLAYHPERARLWASDARFRVVVAGRRSGKTELAKRHLVGEAIDDCSGDGRYFAAAPTRDQAKDLYWEDLKAMVPSWMVRFVSEVHLTLHLVNGARIVVVGLDKPQRFEGKPWNGGIVDEVDDMKPDAWEKHIRPALADRQGWVWFLGAPNGRFLLYKLFQRERQGKIGWASFRWSSEEVLPLYAPGEIESLREDMAEDTYALEVLAEFNALRGRAYKSFDERHHAAPVFRGYDRTRPLILCVDFNVEPGAAVVCQEMALPRWASTGGRRVLEWDRDDLWWGTAVIGEVAIPVDSSTERICRRFLRDWRGHAGEVHVYGDPAGGSRHTSQSRGTDWDIVRQELDGEFHGRLRFFIDRGDPGHRARVNAINSRLMTKAGVVRLMVDPREAPELVLDLEGVRLLEGGSGEINKKDLSRTHWSDALGYYLARRFPARTMRPPLPRARVRLGGSAG